MSEQHSVNGDKREWEEAVRLGGMQSFAHYRRLVLSGREWSEDDRQGMLHLLDSMEECLVDGWQLIDELRVQTHKRMTQRAVRRIREA